MLARLKCLLPALLALLLTTAPPAAQQPAENPNIRFGMPAPAKADPKSREAYLIERPQYVLSYNARTLTPNWVAWRLRKEDIGQAARAPFQPDPGLPRNFPHVVSGVYTGSGFDRGHMCPAKDRSADQADCNATFYMTNIVPQSPASNQKGWERLEDYCRRLAREGHVLYIACGPHGAGGVGKDGPAEEIGKGRLKVTVPHELWKVILVLPRADAVPRKNTRVIAVVMPNIQSVGFDWTKYRTTARAVEKLSKGRLRFFGNVADAEVAEALRDHLDTVQVRVPVPKRPKRGGAR
jgi:endonuclease G